MANWDDIYSEKNLQDATPAKVLTDNLHLLPEKGLALDFASGLAASAFVMGKNNFHVEAWDASQVAVDKINNHSEKHRLNVKATEVDVEKNPPAIKEKFDVIVVSYFLYREKLNYLYDLLKKDGVLFYQTFCGDQINGNGPSRSDFRLQRGELLKVFSNMQLLFYREDNEQSRHEQSQPDIVQFVAMK